MFIVFQLISTIVMLACTLFQVDLVISSFELTIFLMLTATSVGVMNLYIYCYYGKHATDCYAAYADYLFESNWSFLPNKTQRNFVLMIAQTQKPLQYHGFGVVYLNLELFCKVSLDNKLSFVDFDFSSIFFFFGYYRCWKQL